MCTDSCEINMHRVPNKRRSKSIIKDSEESRKPEVILDFEYDNSSSGGGGGGSAAAAGILYIIIENIGLSSAYNISIKFDKEITGVEGNKKISAMKIFDRIEFLPPYKKIRIFVDTFVSYMIRRQPLVITTMIRYSDKENRKIQEVIKHDLSIYQDFPHIIT
jgi:hypothetical protein